MSNPHVAERHVILISIMKLILKRTFESIGLIVKTGKCKSAVRNNLAVKNLVNDFPVFVSLITSFHTLNLLPILVDKSSIK